MALPENLYGWATFIVAIMTIANTAWLWISQPARDVEKKIKATDEKIEELEGAVEARADRHREDLKDHDRRIQRLEDQMAHLPTKEDLHKIDIKVMGVTTELDTLVGMVRRIDDFLRSRP